MNKIFISNKRLFPGIMGMIILLSINYIPLYSQVFYEAEAAKLSQGAVIQDCIFCSGGKQVKGIGGVGGAENGSVLFDSIPVSKPGLYPVTIYFVTGDDRSFTITVNNEEIPRELIFFTTAGGKAVSSKSILVPLGKGYNRILVNNRDEGSPELDKISLANEPVESYSISGTIKEMGNKPVANLEVFLSGNVNSKTITNASGYYEFKFLPKGDYYVTPVKEKNVFAPYDSYLKNLSENKKHIDFSTGNTIEKQKDISVMEMGNWRIDYDCKKGLASFFYKNKPVIIDAFAVVKLPVTVTSMDFKSRKVNSQPLEDGNGTGKLFTVELSNSDTGKMIQTFRIYDKADYILTDVAVYRKSGVSTNYIAPIISRSAVSFLPDGDNRALFVPFDNDKWVRYNAYPFNTSITSYEASAFYNNASREGLVIGSVEHDTWKTAVKSSAYGNSLNSLEVFGGVSSNKTRDVLPHGKISGTTVKSPMIFIGYFSDWRMGMDSYAKANAVVSPARVWTKGTPFGWNSWGKIQGNLTYEKAIQVSDFFAKELQPNSFQNDKIVYVGLDSWWDRLTDDQLKLFADRCKANGQEAGIYWAPFTQWGRDDNATVQGSDYIYKDIYLYANGQKQYLDGGTAIDPTHPASKKRMEYFINRFKKAGFKYLKVDFLTHGAFEADSHYNPGVTTGIQAYNEGMKYLVNLIGDDMFLNQAISPAFPGNYAHSRRIACDAWGAISQTEYTMNALTYGWWLANVYRFNDADHVVLGDHNDGENRARVTSSVITGIYILGDDFSDSGDNSGKERAKKYVTNNEINAIAKLGKSFRPLYGNMGNNASGVFFLNEKKCVYVALFNFSNQKKPYSVNVEEIGIQLNREFSCKELWSGKESKSKDTLKVEVPANDVKVFRIFKD